MVIRIMNTKIIIKDINKCTFIIVENSTKTFPNNIIKN